MIDPLEDDEIIENAFYENFKLCDAKTRMVLYEWPASLGREQRVPEAFVQRLASHYGMLVEVLEFSGRSEDFSDLMGELKTALDKMPSDSRYINNNSEVRSYSLVLEEMHTIVKAEQLENRRKELGY